MDTATPATLTRDLGRFAALCSAVPASAIDVARKGVVDALGLILAARNEPVVQSVRQVATQGNPAGRSSILLTPELTRCGDAALINGTAAHAFAMDDVAWGCHPSAMLLPALLACGEDLGATMGTLLRAWVVGYEVLAEMASREPDSLHPTGWHPSGLLGPVAVAAAVGNLRGFNADQCSRAMAIAASMTGGLSVNFGTQTKAVHAGRVAQAGILAADLAIQGVTAAADALERESGLLRTISPAKRSDIVRPMKADGSELKLLSAGLSLKKYPLCYSVHRIADAGIDLSRRREFDPGAVARIEIAIGRRQAAMARNDRPETILEAKYSVPFAVTCGLLTSAAGFAQLNVDFIQSAPVRRLLALTEVELRDDTSAEDPVFSNADRVRVTLAGGEVLDSGDVCYARGHARLPIDAAQLRAKFIDCASAGGVQDAAALYGRLVDCDPDASVGQIAQWAQLEGIDSAPLA